MVICMNFLIKCVLNFQFELFCINRRLFKTNINIYGIFDVNLSFLFKMITQMLTYFIFLLQIYVKAEIFDYNNEI